MKDTTYLWLEEPETYYPEPKTIRNIIKWHIVLADRVEAMSRADRPKSDIKGLVAMSSIKISPETDRMFNREVEYFHTLGYTNVALIEAAMLLGRELYYWNRTGCTEYEEEIKEIGLRDLHKWMEVFEIPPTIETGGNLEQAVEYTLSKITPFLQTYIDYIEGRMEK
ncbi:MAG: hypothetical protein K6E53_11700 [Lachnospiraceae bacterium]|nr:hypothetical protein [Lachnospiraceae bacterium]